MSEPKQAQESTTDSRRGHDFDGIDEYDNDLPRWWVIKFIATIVFSVGYLAWYHLDIFPGTTLAEEHAAAVAAGQAAATAAAASAPADFDFAAAAKDAATLAGGRETFTAMCAACHGAAGQGVVGPNLTDDFWIHGATTAAVEKLILAGALDKGMPAWGEVLGRDKVRQVVAFIMSLQGSKPADAKAPQGEGGQLR